MTLPVLSLKPLRPERYGHPWIFAGEIAGGPEPAVEDGEWVELVDHNGKSTGGGYFNGRSKIVARRVAHLPGADEGAPKMPHKEWWRARIAAAFAYRKARGLTQRGFYRLVHAEADGLPGLIVDAYGPYVSVQFLTLGMDRCRDEVTAALQSVLTPKGIYERSDAAVRKLEGLEERVGLLEGMEPPDRVELEDDGVTILVDIKNGGKTGLFLDQIDNQRAAALEASGRSVLNVFSFTGLFSLRAALAGARSVDDVESSSHFQQIASEQWKRNAARTSGCKYRQTIANAFDDLRQREDANYRTDMVILDPPAFTKSRSGAAAALRGYNEINRRALKLLRPGGVLVTCSCSHHMGAEEFMDVVAHSARDAKREIRLIERRGQPPDHPVLPRVSETEYLKALIFAVD